MKVKAWKAWYTKHRVYQSSIHTWEELPKEGTLFLLVIFDEKTAAGIPYREIIHGNRRYFKAIGSSGEPFYKGSLWQESKLLSTYDTKPEWIKEGIYDDDETIELIRQEVMETYSG